jgi:thymidylate synthase (FAD)
MSTGPVVKVLDHGFVELVDHMGNDLSPIRAARVSYDADMRTGLDEAGDDKLRRYMLKNKHTSPFESVQFTFHVKAPIFVFRQWHRHRTWSYNEISARYAELPAEFYVPEQEVVGQQSATNKQVRDVEGVGWGAARSTIAESCRRSFHAYEELLKNGVPRELARSVLPVATYSRMYASVNLLNLFRFLELRDTDHAQYEIRVYALALKELARLAVPKTMAAWEETR